MTPSKRPLSAAPHTCRAEGRDGLQPPPGIPSDPLGWLMGPWPETGVVTVPVDTVPVDNARFDEATPDARTRRTWGGMNQGRALSHSFTASQG